MYLPPEDARACPPHAPTGLLARRRVSLAALAARWSPLEASKPWLASLALCVAPAVGMSADDSTGVIELPASSAAAAAPANGRAAPLRAAAVAAPLTPKVNAWGKRAPKFQLEGPRTLASAAAAAGSTNGEGGAQQALRFRVIDRGDGDAHLTFPYPFKSGTSYRATLRVKSDRDAQVDAMLRRDVAPYDPFAIKSVKVTQRWQTVELEGTAVSDAPASLRLASKTLDAPLWVDKVNIEAIEGNPIASVNTDPIPDEFFGVHLMRLGSHQNWPSFRPGVVRLWDTRTTWKDLQPEPGQWDFSGPGWRRLDLYVNHIRKHDPDTKIIYTMGQSPTWASSQPEWRNGYGLGHGAPPRDLEHWRDYVRTVGKRYAGKIRYWEVWNEADYSAFYKGPVETMVQMTRIARDELKAIDPANQILSPGLTAGQGVQWLDRFLAEGGGKLVDIIAFHWYYDVKPESLASPIRNVRRVMQKHGVGDKPLWNTEGSLLCNAKVQNCKPIEFSEAQLRSHALRAMLTMWNAGVRNFDYYFWEGRLPGEAMLERDYKTPTLAGRSYNKAVEWLRGARVVDAYRSGSDIYVYRMQRGDQPFVIAWSLGPETTVRLPAEWQVGRAAKLDGDVERVPENRQVKLGLDPVLLQ
ncbi:glycosyl hydrolase [Caldimonas brevitalea]|uniref:Asl1-like glycosyl hydrolase catalytic domain-containing protein n=1 Tax=Caldimonas brevitalea TaxID=413882 RepID=A0A0G3BMZ6_9BURK|nr:glycosyl hydrolase [Caldimonas brevitalea]AKJ27920.1 hypothetical protein AAW51_1229 [Caldimonas brevitalea]